MTGCGARLSSFMSAFSHAAGFGFSLTATAAFASTSALAFASGVASGGVAFLISSALAAVSFAATFVSASVAGVPSGFFPSLSMGTAAASVFGLSAAFASGAFAFSAGLSVAFSTSALAFSGPEAASYPPVYAGPSPPIFFKALVSSAIRALSIAIFLSLYIAFFHPEVALPKSFSKYISLFLLSAGRLAGAGPDFPPCNLIGGPGDLVTPTPGAAISSGLYSLPTLFVAT